MMWVCLTLFGLYVVIMIVLMPKPKESIPKPQAEERNSEMLQGDTAEEQVKDYRRFEVTTKNPNAYRAASNLSMSAPA